MSPCRASFEFSTLEMGTQLNPSGVFDRHLLPAAMSTNGAVTHKNGWIEYARPLASLIMAYIFIGLADSINIGITDRLDQVLIDCEEIRSG